MGTYRATFSEQSNAGFTHGGGAYFIQAATDSGLVTLILTGACFYIDGSGVPVAFSGLPGGFIPLDAALRQTAGAHIGELQKAVNETVVHSRVTYGVYGPTDTTVVALFPSVTHVGIPTLTPVPSAIDLIALLNIAGDITLNPGPDAASKVTIFDNLEVYGNYGIQTYTFTPTQAIIGPTISSAQVQVDTDNQTVPGIMNQVTSIDLDWTDSGGNPQNIHLTTGFSAPNQYTIIFNVPTASFPRPPTSNPTINTTFNIPFGGSVPAGTFRILYESGSGVYRIVANKRNDTLYTSLGNTTDVKIPNPFADTGFIGG